MKEKKIDSGFNDIDAVSVIGLLSIENVRCGKDKSKANLLDELLKANVEVAENVSREHSIKKSKDNIVGHQRF
jgi:hypothetical protein